MRRFPWETHFLKIFFQSGILLEKREALWLSFQINDKQFLEIFFFYTLIISVVWEKYLKKSEYFLVNLKGFIEGLFLIQKIQKIPNPSNLLL